MIRDQNGNKVNKSVKKESNGSWSVNVWFGGFNGFATNVERRYGYRTRKLARNTDISKWPK